MTMIVIMMLSNVGSRAIQTKGALARVRRACVRMGEVCVWVRRECGRACVKQRRQVGVVGCLTD